MILRLRANTIQHRSGWPCRGACLLFATGPSHYHCSIIIYVKRAMLDKPRGDSPWSRQTVGSDIPSKAIELTNSLVNRHGAVTPRPIIVVPLLLGRQTKPFENLAMPYLMWSADATSPDAGVTHVRTFVGSSRYALHRRRVAKSADRGGIRNQANITVIFNLLLAIPFSQLHRPLHVSLTLKVRRWYIDLSLSMSIVSKRCKRHDRLAHTESWGYFAEPIQQGCLQARQSANLCCHRATTTGIIMPFARLLLPTRYSTTLTGRMLLPAIVTVALSWWWSMYVSLLFPKVSWQYRPLLFLLRV